MVGDVLNVPSKLAQWLGRNGEKQQKSEVTPTFFYSISGDLKTTRFFD